MVEQEMDAGEFVNRSEAESTPFASALGLHAKEVTSKKYSSASELSRIQAMQHHPLSLSSLASIRGSDMVIYRDIRLEKELVPSAVRRELAPIPHVFNIACKTRRMDSLSNPVELIREPNVDDSLVRRILSANVWTLKKEELVCEHLNELEMICRYTWSAELPKIMRFAETAMHRSEITSVLRNNVDLDRHVALLQMTKNGSARNRPLSPKAIEFLKTFPNGMTITFLEAGQTPYQKHLVTLMTAYGAYRKGLSMQLKQRNLSPAIEKSIEGDHFLREIPRYSDAKYSRRDPH